MDDVKLIVRLPQEMRQALKVKAALQNTTMQALVQEAIKRLLETDQKEAKPRG